MFTDQVLCPSEFSDPVLPVQEHCLLHRTGAATTLKLFQSGYFHIFIFLYFSYFSYFDRDSPIFRCFTCSTPTSVLRYQDLAHCFGVLVSTFESTVQVIIDLKILQTLFESTFLVLYNTIYTSIPGRRRSHLVDLDLKFDFA